MAVELKTYNEILGQLIRKIVADTPVNDLSPGSVLLTLLEAIAANDFDNSTSILSVLETLNIDAIKNQDLDARAADYGLTRKPAQRATGFIKISDSNITKRATTLYAVKPPPVAGSSVIYVNNAADWSSTGALYIGRGTQQFEGPISYTSIVNNGSFYTITLASALQKDHLISDSVIDSQGNSDRLIPANTEVIIPANNQNPEIKYSTLRDAILPAGEDSVGNIAIVAQQVGVRSNASINTIVAFGNPPFDGATVTNTSVLSDGADSESDDELRERIRAYSSTLARGTRDSIISSILNISDPDDGKQVASAIITEPAEIGDPSIVYIDDGSGFQPTYSGQPLDVLLSSATGNEEFLQLANFPLPRPQVVNSAEGPYQILDGMKLRVKVDIFEEEVTFSSSQFINISAATPAEVVVAINDQAINFRARLTDNSSKILLSPLDDKSETIQVLPQRSDESLSVYANGVFVFPTTEYSYIKLYRNNTLLRSTQRSATITSSPFSTWNISTPGNLILQVDGTPTQDVSFTTVDFGGASFASLELSDWVAVFNKKYAGITAQQTSSGSVTFVSNRDGAASSISAVGGSYLNQVFGTNTLSDSGQDSDFAINRQTGNIQLKFKPSVGDSIVAGNTDSKGSFSSIQSNTGVFNLSTDGQGRTSQLVVSIDGSADVRSGVSFIQGNAIAVQDMGGGVMRVIGNTLSSFAAAQLGDYLWITNRGDVGGSGSWVGLNSCGLFKILRKGDHTSAGVDTWIEVYNSDIVAGGPYSVQDTNDIIVFESKTYPQIWSTSSLATPAAATLQSIVTTLTKELSNVKSQIFKTNTIKSTSSTEESGSIALPVSVGKISNIFPKTLTEQTGNPTHIATKISNRDLFGYLRMESSDEAFLNRSSYKEAAGILDAASSPGIEGIDPYSELLSVNPSSLSTSDIELDDILMMDKANNSNHFRSIKELQPTNDIGTQHALPRTLLDHVSGDEMLVVRPMSITAEDSAIFVLDNDLIGKTINVNFWRTGRINNQYVASTTAFSADDYDNEPGINFGSLAVWSKTLTDSEFKDYGVLFRARNWYRTGGAANSGGATMILRAKEYGRSGEKIRFKLEYPTVSNQSSYINHINFPNYSIVTATLGSDDVKNIGVISGTTFKVTSTSSNIYRYTFQQPYVDLNPLVPGDIVSVQLASGVSGPNCGVFSVENFDSVNRWIEVYNPNGATTLVGQKEVSEITTIPDILGTPQITDITCTDQGSTSATVGSSEYFTLYDDVGLVVFWYDIDNAGATPTPVLGAYRYVKISTVSTGDLASVVASKTATAINSDFKFSAYSSSNLVTVTNNFNGPVTLGSAGPDIGFAVALNTAGTVGASLGGKYFLLQDDGGSVAVWFNVNSEPEPSHGASRSIQVFLSPGDSADTVASKIQAQIDADSEFMASVLTNVVTITNEKNGARTDVSAGTSGFTATVDTQGINDGVETISVASLFQVFPLAQNTCQEVCNLISTSPLMTAVPIGDSSLLFTKSTSQDIYAYSGNSSALAYDHDPNPLNLKNDFVSLWDGFSFVKIYENSNPQFVLKKELLLPGVAPTIYNMSSCPNPNTADVGEIFKLVPKTIANIKHHMSHKALSQLSLVADVDITNNYRRIQVRSKKLGTDGAVEMIGGNANSSSFELLNDAQFVLQGSDKFAELRVSAFPSSIAAGDYVKIKNKLPAKRLSRLIDSDKVDVVNTVGDIFEFKFMPKSTNSGKYVPWTITDASSSYSLPAGTMWRWTHDDAGSTCLITALVNGTVLTAPADYQSDSTPDSPELHVADYVNGSATSAASFALTLSSYPTSRSFFRFQTQGGSPTIFAVWFDVSGSDALPTGTEFTSATYKIRVDVSGVSDANSAVSLMHAAIDSDADFNAHFLSTQTAPMALTNVNPGDILAARPTSAFNVGGFLDRWKIGNVVRSAGDGVISGLPIVAVNSTSKYVDVLNPWGAAMSTDYAGDDGTIDFLPAMAIKWHLGHRSRVKISSLDIVSNTATVVTVEDHGLNVGDSVVIEGVDTAIPVDGTHVVSKTLSQNEFTFSISTGDASFLGGVMTRGSVSEVTQYSVEEVGFNNLFRYRRISGPSPRFKDLGVAVDDYALISGSTFFPQNTGRFRILSVSNDHIVVENPSGTEQLHGVIEFNEEDKLVNWIAASNTITTTRSAIRRVTPGCWIKKSEDPDSYYVQVSDVVGGTSPSSVVTITLVQPYPGLTGLARGVLLNQNTGAGAGVTLRNHNDIQVFEGDATFSGDSLIVENIANANWFNTSNSGVREIIEIGSSLSDHTQFLRVNNASGVNETSRLMSVKLNGIYVLENPDYTYETNRYVNYTAINPTNNNQRSVYVTPSDRVYKMSSLSQSVVSSEGKIGMEVGVTTGVNGYSYYTGLMRTVQRIIDGFEPDPSNFPGRRAVGSIIEILPPLIRSVSISVNVTTKDGVNLTDITNDIKSVIISYISSLGVGEDVILSEIIARIMTVSGVAAVTFTNPIPSTERIVIADDAKAFISPESISVS